MAEIKRLFEKAVVETTYVDSKDGQFATEPFYGTAIPGDLKKWDGLYEGFTLTLTALNPYEERQK